MTRQLPLDLGPSGAPSLANFVPGRNGPLLHLLEGLVVGTCAERQLHLWGAKGCGKSHLLRALNRSPGARYLAVDAVTDAAEAFDPSIVLWCVDDVERADAAAQSALFHLVNAVRATPKAALVTAGDAPPLHLRLREDLRTRLGWGPVFQVEPLDDSERAAALAQRAHERGLTLSDEVCSYLLTHFSRDMPSLIAVLDGLDRFALERQRAITVPLVREWLQRGPAAHPVS